MRRDRLAQGPQSTCPPHPGHRREEEEGRGDGGEDREDKRLVLHEIHERQVEEVMETLSEGPGGFYGQAVSFRRNLLP